LVPDSGLVSNLNFSVVDRKAIALAEENKKAIDKMRHLHMELVSRVNRVEDKQLLKLNNISNHKNVRFDE